MNSICENFSLKYLKKYAPDIKSIDFGSLNDSEKSQFPTSWVNMLYIEGKERNSEALKYWRTFTNEFEQVVKYLEGNLVSIDLVHHSENYSLLYGIKSSDGSETMYYEGRNPNSKIIDESIQDSWDLLPEKLRSFYDNFHNGWYYFASRSIGLSPVESFFFLSREDWGNSRRHRDTSS